MTKRKFALALALVACSTVAANGYNLFGPKWAVQQVPYYVNPANGDGIPEDSATADIQAAAMAWTSQSNADIVPTYMGRTSGTTASMNGRNEVFFRNASNNAAAATTYWWSDSSNRMLEADIVVWDATYTFVSNGSPCSGGVYLQDVMTHEFGHALGLAHSPVGTATMYSVISWCSMEMRSLDADDLAGIEKLYPGAGANSAPTVTIDAPSNDSTVPGGSPLTFSGSANDREDGNVAPSMVWSSSVDGQIGTGPSFARVLSAGTHVITAWVSDSKGATAQTQRSVTVQPVVTGNTDPAPTAGITLAARGYKVKGLQKVELTWSGSDAAWMDVYRNGTRIAITQNGGRYTDPVNAKGSASYTYAVCNSATTTCSSSFKISF
jgi:hypothetical protein